MKATLLAENLQKKISFLNHVVSSRSQLPILSNILLKTIKGGIEISATDLEVGLITVIPASIEEEGEVTIPAKILSDLSLNIREGKISLEENGTNILFKAPSVEATLQTMPADDFPKIYEEKGEIFTKIKRDVLEQKLSRIVFSAAQDGGRPSLSGVLVDQGVDGLTIVATDGYRLSLEKGISLGSKGNASSVLVPARVFKELLSVKEDDGEVTISISKKTNQIIFTQGETVLVGRLIEAEYPPFEKIIPTSHSITASFEKGKLLNAVKICSVFARDAANIIKLSLKKNKIVVSANTPSVGENKVDVEAKINGEENEIAFNARYLLDLLGNIDEEDLVFEMTGPLNPGVFKIKDNPHFLHLIMPIRVQG
jgi:DNA polymerase III subunit beta